MRGPARFAMLLALACGAVVHGAAQSSELDELRDLERALPGPGETERPTPPPPPEYARRGPGADEEPMADFIAHGPASGALGGQLPVRWVSEYFFRGLRFSENDVLQAEPALWFGGFKAQGFFNYDLEPDEMNEARGSISYSYPLTNTAAIEAGYTYYGYPHRVIRDTQEVFAGIRHDQYIDASIYGYYDWDEGTGALWEFSIGKHVKVPVSGALAIDPFVRATAVLNARYFNHDTEFSHGLFSAGIPIYLGENVILGGTFEYQWGWQGWVDDQWWLTGGVTFRF